MAGTVSAAREDELKTLAIVVGRGSMHPGTGDRRRRGAAAAEARTLAGV
jgi:hypothetical protein